MTQKNIYLYIKNTINPLVPVTINPLVPVKINPLVPGAFFLSNIKIQPKIASYCLPIHRRNALKKCFPLSLLFQNGIMTIR